MAIDKKEYMKEYMRKYRQSEKFKAYQKKYVQSEKFKAYQKKYVQSEKFKAYQKKYQQSEKFKAYHKKYYQSEKGKAAQKKYYQSEKFKATHKKWRKSEKGRSVYSKSRKNMYHNNPIFKLQLNMRPRLAAYLKKKKISKTNKTFQYIGCTPKELKTYIENKFQPGMTWDNWGVYGWHIDHVIALSSAKTEDEFMKLFHYTNLQPLWAKDNLSKSNKVIPRNGN